MRFHIPNSPLTFTALCLSLCLLRSSTIATWWMKRRRCRRSAPRWKTATSAAPRPQSTASAAWWCESADQKTCSPVNRFVFIHVFISAALWRLMAQHKVGERVVPEDVLACVKKHRLFPQAEASVRLRIPDIKRFLNLGSEVRLRHTFSN